MRRISAVFCAYRWAPVSVVAAQRFCLTRTNDTQATYQPKSLNDVEGLSQSDKKLIFDSLNDPSASPAKMGGSGIGPKHGEMVAAFTCTVCETRSVKRFTKLSYTKGIVIVECPGCFNKHLLADNLGWFDDKEVNIEEILKAKGESVIRVPGSVYVEPPSE